MTGRKTRAAGGFALFVLLAWLLASSAALAQVEQAHLRIDGMT